MIKDSSDNFMKQWKYTWKSHATAQSTMRNRLTSPARTQPSASVAASKFIPDPGFINPGDLALMNLPSETNTGLGFNFDPTSPDAWANDEPNSFHDARSSILPSPSVAPLSFNPADFFPQRSGFGTVATFDSGVALQPASMQYGTPAYSGYSDQHGEYLGFEPRGGGEADPAHLMPPPPSKRRRR
jgi:hypothetical protein